MEEEDMSTFRSKAKDIRGNAMVREPCRKSSARPCILRAGASAEVKYIALTHRSIPNFHNFVPPGTGTGGSALA